MNRLKNEEQYAKYKKQWLKEQYITILILIFIILGLFIFSCYHKWYLLIGITAIFAFSSYIVLKNKMIIYIEKNIYDEN